jgi:hypothetical protein
MGTALAYVVDNILELNALSMTLILWALAFVSRALANLASWQAYAYFRHYIRRGVTIHAWSHAGLLAPTLSLNFQLICTYIFCHDADGRAPIMAKPAPAIVALGVSNLLLMRISLNRRRVFGRNVRAPSRAQRRGNQGRHPRGPPRNVVHIGRVVRG